MKGRKFLVTNSQTTYDTSGESSEINNNDKTTSQKVVSNDNNTINISINCAIKSILKIVLDKEGINIFNPSNCIEIIYQYIPDEIKYNNITKWKCRIESFVNTFISLIKNVKKSVVAKAYDIDEKVIDKLLLKELFKALYLQSPFASIELYKKNEHFQMKNYKIIFTIIKMLEYGHNECIIGLKDYKDSSYEMKFKFNWYVKFIDYIIVSYYLKNDTIMTFNEFFNKIEIEKAIHQFDNEREFDIYHFYSLNKNSFCQHILEVVENVIINIVKCFK